MRTRTRHHYDPADYGSILPQFDTEILNKFVKAMDFDEMRLLSNFQSNMEAFMAPSGYVATVFKAHPFKYHAFLGLHRLFRGMALVEVKLAGAMFTDAVRDAFRSHINLFLRDVSPHPPRVTDTPTGGWVCELGRCGWVGLYQARRVQAGHAAFDHKTVFYVRRRATPR